MNILLLSGSFHGKSRSLMLIRVLEQMLKGHQCHTPDLRELPYFADDLYEEAVACREGGAADSSKIQAKPQCGAEMRAVFGDEKLESVQAFWSLVTACDGIIVVSPEHNHSIPAVLKNAIDWASRPAFASPLKGKPVTFITQAESPVGGARAQAHLKLVFDATLSRIQPAHEMMITCISKVFDEQKCLVDATVQRRLSRHIEDFLAFAARS